MRKLLVLMTALIMVVAMTACSNIEPSDDGSDAKMINVKIEIDFPDVDDEDLEKTEKQDIEAAMTVEEGTTVIDMLYSYADANGIKVGLDESSPTLYVTSIDGVEQTNDAGWIYEVNDELAMEAADAIVLEEGMEVTWEYTSWSDL